MELPRRPEGSSLTIVVELVDVAGNVNELEFVQ